MPQAQPSTAPGIGGYAGTVRLVRPDETVDANETLRSVPGDEAQETEEALQGLAAFVRTEFDKWRIWRQSEGVNDRLLHALRMFNGRYDPGQLHEIRAFGGSEVFARLTASKCRGAFSLLRDIYLSAERPWALKPTPDPETPEDGAELIAQVIQAEIMSVIQRTGEPPAPDHVQDRYSELNRELKDAAYQQARKEARLAEQQIDDVLVEGRFYDALAEFLIDLPRFPFAVLKGPVVEMTPQVDWVRDEKTGVTQAQETVKPKLFWKRVSPFDMWWTPGVHRIEDAGTIERMRLTRASLNRLLGLPGYDQVALRAVLAAYPEGYRELYDATDTERADDESREDPTLNNSRMIDALEYNGPIRGDVLLDYGMTAAEVPDPGRDYYCQCWLVGRYVIKAQIAPIASRRHPYYITSFEKIPGTVVGNGLPDIIADQQEGANAALRALVNNMAMGSGPMVAVDETTIGPTEAATQIHPWKVWSYIPEDGVNANRTTPITFFQPQMNAQELLGIYRAFTEMADDISGIPRYATGNQQGLGGAGRTASGLAMLMGNASKVLQSVAANVDLDVMGPLLRRLYEMLLLTPSGGGLRGDEEIRVLGVEATAAKDIDRMRQLEFLQLTANPLDQQIMGPEGRASLLRALAQTTGLRGERIVPPEEEMEARAMQQRQQQALMQQQMLQRGVPPEQGGQPGPAGQGPPTGERGNSGVKPGQSRETDNVGSMFLQRPQ